MELSHGQGIILAVGEGQICYSTFMKEKDEKRIAANMARILTMMCVRNVRQASWRVPVRWKISRFRTVQGADQADK
jgi:hypothetical protein